MPPHLPTETLHIDQVVPPPQQYGDIESIVNVLTAELVHRGHVIRSGQVRLNSKPSVLQLYVQTVEIRTISTLKPINSAESLISKIVLTSFTFTINAPYYP